MTLLKDICIRDKIIFLIGKMVMSGTPRKASSDIYLHLVF